MKKVTAGWMQGIAWGISTTAAVFAFAAWGQGLEWKFSGLTIYHVFPIFGLLAFSLMWSHYIAAALRQYFEVESVALHKYFEITSTVVLTAILLHPGLLAWQLWRDGLGLPPGGYKMFVGAASYWAVLIALLAWVAFISYELRRVYGKRPWWRFVQYASDGAMFLIFIHALNLGGELELAWFRAIWYFYGLTLAAALAYMYGVKPRQQKKK